MKKKETLFDILLKVSELRMDIETAEKRILRLFNVIKSLPEYNEILYHAKTLSDEQFREYWTEVQGNVL